MNKLVIDNNIETTDIFVDTDTDMIVDLNDSNKELNIHIAKGMCVKGFIKTKNTSNKITYVIDEDCDVKINKLSIDCSDDITIEMNDVNSKVKYTTSVINYLDNTYTQKVLHNSSKTKSIITNHCINVDNNEFKFIVDGVVKRESEDINFKQDNRIINLKDGKSNILPNLIVDNCEVEASHSAYIGTFNEDDIFYMMSRGLTKEECDDLLIKAFLIGNMDLTEKEHDIYCGIIETINK